MDNDVIIERLENLLRENSEEHKNILAQVTKTNGSVTDLMKWKERLFAILIFMNIFLVPVIVAVFTRFTINYIF